MNYQSLIYFKRVAELQHFTRAAAELFITQPALSKAIHNLEAELGTSLFVKDGRRVTLTQCGSIFYEFIKRSVEEIDKGVDAIRHQVELERNTIIISSLFSMYAIYLPDKILRFRQQYPLVRFSLEYKYTTAVLNDLLTGHAELGLCSDYDEHEEELRHLENYVLYNEPIGLIVGKDHPFATRNKVGVDELRSERFIVYIKSSRGTNKILHDLCAPYGFEPNIVMEAYNDYGVISSVISGYGIAVMPTSGFLNVNSVIPVALDVDFPLTREIKLVWRRGKELPILASAFKKMLIEMSKEDAAFSRPFTQFLT